MLEKLADIRPAELANQVVWPEEDLVVVDGYVNRGAELIREFYYRQLHLIRLMPYLALEIDGRGGWNSIYSMAYSNLIFPIHDTRSHHDLYIELRTGLLLSTQYGAPGTGVMATGPAHIEWSGGGGLYPASDKIIYNYLAHDANRFTPVRFIEWAIAGMQEPYHNDQASVDMWLREKERVKQQLEKVMAATPYEAVVERLQAQGYAI
jgi:hypothetical protein